MAEDFGQKSQAFVSWLTSLPGVTISPKIRLADFRERGAGRGVQAIEDIDADEDLFSIPRTCVLSAKNSDLFKIVPVLAKYDELPEAWMCLVLIMTYEYLRGAASPWKPYLDLLPTSFDTLMFWSEEELAELRGSAVVEKIGKQDADEAIRGQLLPDIRRHEQIFQANALSDSDLSELLHRMSSIVMAYAFDVDAEDPDLETEWDEEEVVPKSLVPLADMLNADADSNANLFYEPTALAMKSVRPIPAGSEVLNDYGQLPTSDVLRRYGYTTPLYARHDCVEIDATWLETSVLAKHQESHFGHALAAEEGERRRQYLEDQQGLDLSGNFDITWPDNSDNMDFFPDDISRFVKTMLADDVDGPGLSWKKVAKTGMCDDDLMRRFENAMLDAVRARRLPYATTEEEDERLLATPAAATRLRMAILVRLGEKKILRKAEERLLEKQNKEQEDGRARKRARVE